MRDISNDNEDPSALLSVSDADLSAYAEGGLSPARRAQVEGFLACNPDLAARMMSVMHKRGGDPVTSVLKRRQWPVIAAALAGLILVASPWASEAVERWGSPFSDPEFVEDALESRQATLMRVDMKSQAENTAFDPSEVVHWMKVALPALPPTWRVLDAQVYPSEEGPSITLVVNDNGDAHPFYLFAVRADTIASNQPIVTKKNGEYVAYWELNGTAYALSGGLTRAEIESGAALLSGSGPTYGG